nr:MAG TPA: hypothetical protein [Caudoviricetes sp.]
MRYCSISYDISIVDSQKEGYQSFDTTSLFCNRTIRIQNRKINSISTKIFHVSMKVLHPTCIIFR